MNTAEKIGEVINALIKREMKPADLDIVSITVDMGGGVRVHVAEEFFDKHYSYGNLADVALTKHNLRFTVETASGVEIFCLKDKDKCFAGEAA